MKKNIESLNGFRFVLAVFVFLCHNSTFVLDESLAWLSNFTAPLGGIAVTAFFVLSGFCVYLGYSKKFQTVTKETYLEFEKKRIKKIYPLYFFTNVIALLIQFAVQSFSDHTFLHLIHRFCQSGIKFILTSLMVQTLVPGYALAGNGAAWFISCIFLIYLVTPFILHFLLKIKLSNIKAFAGIIICFLVLVIFECIKSLLIKITGENSFVELFYVHPFVRIFEYLFGIFTAGIFLNIKSKEIDKNQLSNEKVTEKNHFRNYIVTLFEIVLFFIPFIINFSSKKINNKEALDCLVFSFFIFVISFEKGCLSFLFRTKIFQFFGSLSMEIYLIHYLLHSSKLQFKFETFAVISHKNLSSFIIFGFIILNFIVTIILSLLWKKYSRKIPIVNLFEKAFDS